MKALGIRHWALGPATFHIQHSTCSLRALPAFVVKSVRTASASLCALCGEKEVF